MVLPLRPQHLAVRQFLGKVDSTVGHLKVLRENCPEYMWLGKESKCEKRWAGVAVPPQNQHGRSRQRQITHGVLLKSSMNKTREAMSFPFLTTQLGDGESGRTIKQ